MMMKPNFWNTVVQDRIKSREAVLEALASFDGQDEERLFSGDCHYQLGGGTKSRWQLCKVCVIEMPGKAPVRW